MKDKYSDFSIIFHINQHYKDLLYDLKFIKSFEDFTNGNEIRRAILFDFLQIGELLNQLSKDFLNDFNNKHTYDTINIRNRIVHGYGTVDDAIIYSTLKNDFDTFVYELNLFASKRNNSILSELVGKYVEVYIVKDIDEKVSEGYIPGLTTLDNCFQKVYVIKPLSLSTKKYKVVKLIKNSQKENVLILASKETNLDDLQEYISLLSEN